MADPELNGLFLAECRRLGLAVHARVANLSLLNLRKRGLLRGLNSKRTVFRDQSDYAFASEMAIRFLERREGFTLDKVICDPDLAREFDGLAERLAPGYSPLRYRWAALALRKARRLQPEPLGQALRPIQVEQFQVNGLEIDRIPATQGLYIFFEPRTCLYVGETENLNGRIRKHLAFSDNRGVAHWLWEHGSGNLHLEIQVLASSVSTRARKAMERELIRSRRPLFNVAGSSTSGSQQRKAR